MSAQKTLLNFFQKQPGTKRMLECTTNIVASSSEAAEEKEAQIDKRAKTDDDVENVEKSEKTAFSNEVKSPVKSADDDAGAAKIENNKYAAKMKLTSTQTCGLINNFGVSWFKALEQEFSKSYFVKLAEFVAEERKKHTIFPPENQVFSWTQFCSIDEVKVVILGQDPYHGPNQAHGLCFSVRKSVTSPPSLNNIYKELKTDIDNFEIPKHGTLIGWATQGVLLLNACLTVRKSEANSHKDRGWETFTDSVVKVVNHNLSNVVFLMWGAYAQKRSVMIDKKKHLILNCVHPSPLSASRGWFGCKHFSKANEYLVQNGKKPIDWTYLPSEDQYEASLKNSDN